MKYLTMLLALVATVALSAPLNAQTSSPDVAPVNQLIRQQEMLQQDVALKLAPIKSTAGLERHLRVAGSKAPFLGQFEVQRDRSHQFWLRRPAGRADCLTDLSGDESFRRAAHGIDDAQYSDPGRG